MGKRKSTTDAAGDAPAEIKTTDEARPNVKLAAKAKPLGAGTLTVGMKVIGELPNEETQRAGWPCSFAKKLVQLYPERFRLIVEKGQ